MKTFVKKISEFVSLYRTFFITLFIVNLLLVAIRSTFPDKIVFFGKHEKPDAIQAFYKAGKLYTEDSSERTPLITDFTSGIKFPLPLSLLSKMRIDPANDVNTVTITRIELRYIFNTVVILPADIVASSKPIQMIDRFELTPAGVEIHSTGNDPAFELQITNWLALFQNAFLFLISILLSFILVRIPEVLVRIPMGTRTEKAFLIGVPLAVSIAIAALFYPGAMSYDSLHSVRSARNGIVDSIWPPMVSYVWRIVDLVSTDPSAMHFAQIALLLLSFFTVLYVFTGKISSAAKFLIIYVAVPVILGTLAVIWKDVLMAAFLLSGFTVVLLMNSVKARWKFVSLGIAAVILLFIGVCSRHNALAGAIPIFFYLAYVMGERLLPIKKPVQYWLSIFMLGAVSTVVVYEAKKYLDNYSLPGFVKLKNETHLFLEYVRVLDVAGASICVGQNLFEDMAPERTVGEIAAVYDPKHVNLSLGVLNMVNTDIRINRIWKNVAVNHPLCFLSNKIEMTKYLLGWNNGDQFLITQLEVEKNEYGWTFADSALRDAAYGYIIRASKFTIFRPWFIYLLSIISFVYLVRKRAMKPEYFALFSAGGLYFLSLFLFGNAGDARLTFFTTTALLAFNFATYTEYAKRRKVT